MDATRYERLIIRVIIVIECEREREREKVVPVASFSVKEVKPRNRGGKRKVVFLP